MEFNLGIIALTAIVPLVMGFIWYNPNVFGKAWMKECGFTLESIGKPNPLIFLWCYLLSFLIAFELSTIVIHQYGFFSTILGEAGLNDPTSDISIYAADFMAKFGDNYRTFKHGALHGTILGLFVALPILGTNAMFEKKSFKYVMINGMYWTVSLAIMGGILCEFV